MATAGPLPHGPDVLDSLFQQMRARGAKPRAAQGRILEALKREELVIMAHVAAGAWSLKERQFATREEEVRAQQELRAAIRKYDLDAQSAIVYERSPSPDGITGPIVPEDWEVTVRIAIRDGHLVIEFLDPKFPPESYTFAIATPEVVNELLAAASVQPAASSTVPSATSSPAPSSTVSSAASSPAASSATSSPVAAPQPAEEWVRAARRLHRWWGKKVETKKAWAERLVKLMEEAHRLNQVDKIWSVENMVRRLRDMR
jgi:hypothetical protein